MKKAHFIGICGVGMSATANLLKQGGWEISGSDSEFYPPVSDYLQTHNITLTEGYRKENIPDDADIIVIGKNAKLTPEENEEVKAAYESGKPIRSFPEVLDGLVNDTHNVVVAGSYGKSTCSALLAWCLEHAGKEPGYFIGAVPLNTNETSTLGSGETFVLEGDEYPTSNWDSTSKFLYYHPHDVLLTSAEHDHVNVFPTQLDYLVPFKTLISLLPPDGLLVASADEPNARALLHTHPGKKILYGLDNPETIWSAKNIEYGETTTFTLTREEKSVISISTTLLGKHNIENIVGVAALLLEHELLTPEKLSQGIATFRGIKRRLDLKTSESTIPIYEGFGSSYQKARSAIEAMTLHFPNRRLIVIFEPHTFSWRNKEAIHWYDDVFKEAGLVLVYKPAEQGKDTHEQLSHQDIVNRIEASGVGVHAIRTAEEGLALLGEKLKEDDVVLLLTSGDLGGLIERVPKLAELRFPKISHAIV